MDAPGIPELCIAQVNIAYMRKPLEHPAMADFVDGLEKINALAERSPGFIWRLKTDDGDATSIVFRDDPAWLVNMSVWAGIDQLRDFVYKSAHKKYLKNRQQWFQGTDSASLAIWWVRDGLMPDIDEADRRLSLIEKLGPGPGAFTFGKLFTPQGMS